MAAVGAYGDGSEPSAPLELSDLRTILIRMEETLIYALIERAAFAQNSMIYTVDPEGEAAEAIKVPGFDGCFADYLHYEMECLHSKVRRYTCPEEKPFFSDLPEPILPLMPFPNQILKTDINWNSHIKEMYRTKVIPAICPEGDDGNYGSAATLDITALQALSKRIHYGQHVAEAKYRANPEKYTELVNAKDYDGVMAELTVVAVEQKLLERVKVKANRYGTELGDSTAEELGNVVADLYGTYIMPFTKDVEVEYLKARVAFAQSLSEAE